MSGISSKPSYVSRHQSGEIDVVNHTTGDRCHLKFAPYSYFSRDVARKVRRVCLSHGSEQQAATGSTYTCTLIVSAGDRCGDGQEWQGPLRAVGHVG